jgi:hypothetical protein
MADGEEELELSLGTKKEKKSKSKSKTADAAAVDAAAVGVAAVSIAGGGARPAAGATTASSGAVKYHDYMFLLDRLYQCHNERFGVEKDKEKSRWGVVSVRPHLPLLLMRFRRAGSRCLLRRWCERAQRRPCL